MSTTRFALLAAFVVTFTMTTAACQASPELLPAPAPSEPGAGEASAVVSRAGMSTDAATLTVAGYVSGVIEDGGTCTFVLTSAELSVRDSTVGTVDATNTTCGEVSVPIEQLSSGTWNVRLTYSSPSASAESVALPVEVP